MLIHADPHAEDWDFHQFAETIDIPPSDGNRASLSGVVVREFLVSDLGGRVDGGSSFVHNCYFLVFEVLADQIVGLNVNMILLIYYKFII